ncbi:hypothetical protein Halha_2160 [Halobacteroides halobius DSM 5150]|uniref:Uncharacterized protein n=1 Tax=Halobacteroides halobius (strain ATCC 35273 / DSM 5150 / MD-1) TaxID=748449 RepID=L0KD74_HALHC|nr:hypothetical protein [Halobacteroides halobius]AGB42043.1 hypothetical protein Halha_2160 [Halobacteroides halobius DSM 5150]
MDDISVDSNKVEKLITEIIKLEKKCAHKKSMLERDKRAEIKKLIEEEVEVDVS